jgi:hypothetical protein
MNNSNLITGFIWLILSVATAMIGYTIHGSLFWAIMDFLFMPFAWIKWLICQEVSWTTIKHTFEFLGK